jgi:hypothetical protein
MSRKRTKKNPKDELNAMRKILCDEASNQMKVRNFTKALIGFNQVRKKNGKLKFAPPSSEKFDSSSVVMETFISFCLFICWKIVEYFRSI